MLIDTHAHLNFNAYKNDADEVIRRSLNVWMINIGTNYETSKKAVEISERYPEGVFAAVGLHPIHLETGLVKIKNDEEEIEVKTREEEFDYQGYKALAKSEKVVAIGEIGLDYYWRPKTTKKKELFKQKQKDVLLKQLELAKELNLPVIFHCRMAHEDLIEVLKSEILNCKSKIRNSKLQGVMHGFVGTIEQLEKYLEMGLYIGFNGIIFKNIEGIDFEENIKNTPLDKILIETDCPYLTPPISVNQRLNQHKSAVIRNEPLYVKYIAEKIAKIKNLSYEEIADVTAKNAKKLFKLALK
ncbi:MAG: TatD family hydrolase [Patescibacteria group bacterium]|nr:TatD family hydrolase [Patescibacteria group bacterium]